MKKIGEELGRHAYSKREKQSDGSENDVDYYWYTITRRCKYCGHEEYAEEIKK